MQTKLGSFAEAWANTIVGFAVAWIVWETVIVRLLQKELEAAGAPMARNAREG